MIILVGIFLLTAGTFSNPFKKDKVSATPIIGPNQTEDQIANAIIKTGISLIGKATYSRTEYKKTYPYKFSCATFIDYIFKQNGVDLATYNEDYMLKLGVAIPMEQIKSGDLFFFDVDKSDSNPSHVSTIFFN